MKKLIAVLASAVLVLSALCIVGCGPDNENLIRESLATKLDTYKNADDEVLTELATELERAGSSELGLDSQEVATAVLDGFDYNIDSVTVDGKTAVATVTIVSKSSSDIEKRTNEAFQALQDDPEFNSLSQDEKMDKVSEALMSAYENAEIVTETAEIEYVLNGNTWEPVRGANSLADLDSAIFAQ